MSPVRKAGRGPKATKPTKIPKKTFGNLQHEDVFDEVDDFVAQRQKILLSDDEERDGDEDNEREEAVLDLDVEDSDEDEDQDDGKDVRDGEDPDEVDGVSWGKRKKHFYDADNVDFEEADGEEAEQAAKEEEDEAKRIQKKMLSSLRPEDYEDDLPLADKVKLKKKGGVRGGSLPAKEMMAAGHAALSEGVETVTRDMSHLSKEEMLEVIKADSPELLVLLRDFTDKINDIRTKLQPLIERVRSNELATSKGTSYLEVKFHILLNYCVNIAFYLVLKADGRPIKDHPVIAHLVELRVLLDKMRPLDNKLKYQIDKLLRVATLGQAPTQMDDALRFKPNPKALVSKTEPDELDEHDAGIYRAPKMSAVPYEDQPAAVEKKKREREKLRQKLSKSSLVKGLRDEFSERPEEMGALGPSVRDEDLEREEEERERFEEDNFIRLAISKKDKAKRRDKQHTDPFADFDDFGDLAALGEPEDDLALLRNKHAAKLDLNSLANRKRDGKVVSGDADVPYRDIEELRDRTDKRKAKQQLSFADSQQRDSGEDNMSEDSLYEQVQQQRSASKKAKQDVAETRKLKPFVPSFDDSAEGKRKAGQQILSNRGLTPHRRKDLKNPRVKRRVKYEKAVIKRKSTVRDATAQRPGGSYGGEASGIRANITHSVRIRS